VEEGVSINSMKEMKIYGSKLHLQE